MHFYLSVFWKDTKKDKNKYFSLLTVSDLNDGYKDMHGKQLCQVNHCEVQWTTATNKTHKVFLLHLLKETTEQSWKEESFPSSARGNYRRRHGQSLTAIDSCEKRVQFHENSDGVSAVLLEPWQKYIHQVTFDLAIITYVCLFFFLDKNIYFYKKLIIQL